MAWPAARNPWRRSAEDSGGPNPIWNYELPSSSSSAGVSSRSIGSPARNTAQPHRRPDQLRDHEPLEVGRVLDRHAVDLQDHVLRAHAGLVGWAAVEDLDDLHAGPLPNWRWACGGSGLGPPAIPM